MARGLIPGISPEKDEVILSDIFSLLFDILVDQYPVMSEEFFQDFFNGDSRIDSPSVMSDIFKTYTEFCSDKTRCFCEVCLQLLFSYNLLLTLKNQFSQRVLEPSPVIIGHFIVEQLTSSTAGKCLVRVHRDVDTNDSFEIFGISMHRDGSGQLVLRSNQGLGPYEGAIAAWKEAGNWVDKFVEYCNTVPREEFREGFTSGPGHPYGYWPGIKAIVKNGDVDQFLKIFKQIVDHREDLKMKEAFGSLLSSVQKRMLRFFDSILEPPMMAARSCWMNLIRCFQKNSRGFYDQPYTKKGLDHYSVVQQQLLMAPRFLATTVKVNC